MTSHLDMNTIAGARDIALIVLDTLRFDVADAEMRAGRTPNFAALFPGGWERRHSPGSFTYAAHHAFFAGFLPTPADPEASRERLFACAFAGSETAGAGTLVFEAPDIVGGLAARGYRTIGIGGVGFFNSQSPLSRVFPSLFHESHWSEAMGVNGRDSARLQFALAAERLRALPPDQRAFLFINVSAITSLTPTTPGSWRMTFLPCGGAALYVDGCLPVLIGALRGQGSLLIACSGPWHPLRQRRASPGIASVRGGLHRALCPRLDRLAYPDHDNARIARDLLMGSPYRGYAYAYPHTRWRIAPAFAAPLPAGGSWRGESGRRSTFVPTSRFARCAAASCNPPLPRRIRRAICQTIPRCARCDGGRAEETENAFASPAEAISGGTPTPLPHRAPAQPPVRSDRRAARQLDDGDAAVLRDVIGDGGGGRLGVLREPGRHAGDIGVQTLWRPGCGDGAVPRSVMAFRRSRHSGGCRFPVLNIDLIRRGRNHRADRIGATSMRKAAFRRKYLYPSYVRPLTRPGSAGAR
ncbi:MAG: hypothetical protein R3F11_09340 [Verrucomicrobiales bacterium]